MVTINEIESEYSYIKSWDKTSESYHNSIDFPHQDDFCDVYFTSKNKIITQSQVDRFNNFLIEYEKYLIEINHYIFLNLKHQERKSLEKISNATLIFEVIEVPQNNLKYDFVLLCSKNYKISIGKKYIPIRAEFKDGKILSIKRTKV